MSDSTRELVQTALARRGKTLPARFTEEYFAGLCLRGGEAAVATWESGAKCVERMLAITDEVAK